ncbi:MAG TPA: 2-C-methyl-D-erythritol 4-phosphate cytidylyltransferase [Clostridia bacterium]|jgi:2-C-methyl-D-erythritol 4-phosphate cytidylyltransferase|nr:2-C-methyl-D-erythritol 4-phosphate cytidylyltransferase [Clostridia bacterium]
MKASCNKQFLMLRKKPILIHTLEVFEKCKLVNDIILVSSPGEEDFCGSLLQKYDLKKVTRVVTGGSERLHSVASGLNQVSEDCDIVAVHDGARPLMLLSLLEEVLNAVAEYDGAILAVPVKDTIKETINGHIIKGTLDRSQLWAAQTPQVFKKDVLTYVYKKALEEGITGTDDASLVEYYGYKIKVVPGSYENIKITTPVDLDLAELILKRRG